MTQETWSSTTATTTFSGTHTYAYDASSQLTSADGAGYSYDANGNRTNTGYQTGAANELTTDGVWTYSYDAEGNLTQKSKGSGLETWYYTYDVNNHMLTARDTSNGTSVTYLATYTYDALGRRVEENAWQAGVGTVDTRYALDTQGQVWADLNGSNTVQTRYFWGDGSNQIVARDDVAGGGTVDWYQTDRLGSVRDEFNGTGVLTHEEYTAFGVIVSETNASAAGAVLWQGLRYNRQTGLNDTPNRDLNSATARFDERDPSQFGSGDPNFYRADGNNPVNETDPNGLAGLGFGGPKKRIDPGAKQS